MAALLRPLLLLALAPVFGAVPARAQDKGGWEEFEEVDPYTKGERELLDKLGYVWFDPFPWHAAERTVDVRQNLGGMPMLFVETEHFKIASTLATYQIPNDRDEKDRLKDEVARLKSRLGRLRAPKKELDPWLRLHLVAQRCEELYKTFLDDFGFLDTDFGPKGRHLGQPVKFMVLVCERKSEFGRYIRTYMGVENEFSYRWGFPEGGMFFGGNIEALRERWTVSEEVPNDSELACQMIAGVTSNFLNGYRMNLYGTPTWFDYGLMHYYSRRFDPRWTMGVGVDPTKPWSEGESEWYRRVYNLAKNEFFASTEEAFGWMNYDEMDERAHLIAWSRVEYLMTAAEGDRKAFLEAMCQPRPQGGEEERKADLLQRQPAALQLAFGMTPAQLDEGWREWVLDTYKKRK